MKIQQKFVYNIGTTRFATDLQDYLSQGWRIVPGTLMRGIGDYLVCVVECDTPETLPKPKLWET